MDPRRPLVTVFVLGVACLTSACSSDAAGSPASSATSVSPTASPVGTPLPSVAPSQPSDIPEGVYRTQLTNADLDRLGSQDPGIAGTWTFTFKKGTYRLDCAPLDHPGVDCGGAPAKEQVTVEYGTVHGSAPTVWFVHDMKALSKINGCVPGLHGSRGCGPEDGYHLDWRVDGDSLTFSNYVGLGDEEDYSALNFTAQPWRRIS